MSLKFLVRGQMKHASAKGFDTSMASADGPERDEVVAVEGCPHHIVHMERDIAPVSDLVSLFRMIGLLNRVKPHIIHTHTPKAGLLGMMAGFVCRTPIRIHTLAGWRLQNESGFKRQLLWFAEKMTYWCSHEVWPNSNSLRQQLLDIKFGKPEKLKLIGLGSSNGIDCTEFSPESIDPAKVAAIKTQLEYDPDNIYLISIGRVVAQKGINELVNVFERLQQSHNNLKLIIVGPREEQSDPISSDTSRSIDENPDIIDVGFSNEVKHFLTIANVLVHPSHREGFPNVVLQAGAMNCPIVCSDIGGNIDIVTDEETGLIFKVKNEEDLHQRLEFAIRNPDKIKSMADRLQETIKTNFAREIVQNQIHQEYQRLLQSKLPKLGRQS